MVQQDTLQQSVAEKKNTSFRMIDVGNKSITSRTAVAEGFIYMNSQTFEMVCHKTIPKGDCLALAEISGIMAAKSTPQVLPLCHPLPLEKVSVSCYPDQAEARIRVVATVKTHGKTGVEMEALNSVQGALLCIYDLCKPHDPRMEITGIRLLEKHGGKAGSWYRNTKMADDRNPALPLPWAGLTLCLLTVSDRASSGEYIDRSGPEMERLTQDAGGKVLFRGVVPDNTEKIHSKIMEWLEAPRPDCIIVSGGTGPAPRDLTPEVLRNLADKELTGIGEALRAEGAAHTPYAWLSRSLAVVKKNCLIIALPGSPKAVREGMEVLWKLVPHSIDMIQQKKHTHNSAQV